MTLNIDQRWAIAVLLMACRLGTALLATPLLGSSVPAQVRVLLVIGLAVSLVSMGGSRYGGRLDMPPVAFALVGEVAVGAVLAFGIACAFAAFSLAGRVLDVQTGFALANVFNPISRVDTPIIATALDMLAITVFFSIDGHHALLRGLAFSLEQVPLGAPMRFDPQAVVRQFGVMFSLGLALVAPTFICLFVVELATAVMSRVLPQANVLLVVAPVKIFVGLSVLALSLPMLAPAMRRIYATIFTYWQSVLQHG